MLVDEDIFKLVTIYLKFASCFIDTGNVYQMNKKYKIMPQVHLKFKQCLI